MAWHTGSSLMTAIIMALKDLVKDENTRCEFYRRIIPAFNDLNWNTQNDCLGHDEAFDKTIREIEPPPEPYSPEDDLEFRDWTEDEDY
jgi:hypothetical protein